jgi:hypothetical protein
VVELTHGVAWAVVRAELELCAVVAATGLSIELEIFAAGGHQDSVWSVIFYALAFLYIGVYITLQNAGPH